MPKPSSSMENMESEGYKVFNGLDQNMSDEQQLASKKTASCEGLSFRGGKLSTNQFGYGCLPFNWTKSAQRGYGIVPSTELGKFFTVVAKDDGAGSLTANTHLQSLFDFTSTSIDTHKPRLLVSSGILNGVVCTADGNSMRKYYQTTIADDLSILPTAPTFTGYTGAAGISGTFLYRYVLLDINLNETGGGAVLTTSPAPVAAGMVYNISANLASYVTNPVTQWRYIRFFRTTNGGSTYYFLNQQTLTNGVTTYTYADTTTDAALTGSGSYQLINPTPAPAGFYADCLIVDDNRVIAIATTESGTYYPNRVRWTVLTDSSQTSTGNVNSWRANDYEDIQNDPINENIGGYPGLGGRTYIFAKNGTWAMVGTGDSTNPFSFQQIDSTYGLYHHSVDNCGGFLVGRTRDGFARFDGSTLKPIGTELSSYFKNCALIKGDSGAYDFKNKRFYMTTCDTRISLTYLFISTSIQQLLPVLRNTVVCYDLETGSFEQLSGIYLQVLKNIQDSNGNYNIFGIGFSNDVHIIMKNAMAGSTFSVKASAFTERDVKFTSLGSVPNLVGRKASLPIFINSSNDKIVFMDYTSTIFENGISLGNWFVGTTDFRPVQDTNAQYLLIVDSSLGINDTAVTNKLVDNNKNWFLQSCLNAYSVQYSSDAGQSYISINNSSGGGALLGLSVDSGLIITTNGYTSPTVPTGATYVIRPRPLFGDVDNSIDIDYSKFKSPLFGTDRSINTKCFRYGWLNVRGTGVLRVRTYLDGNSTVDETRYVTLSDSTKWVMTRVDLKGSTGDTMAVEIGMAKGAGDFECQELSLFWRKLGRLRNA